MLDTDSNLLNALDKKDLISLLGKISNHLKENYNLSDEEISKLSKGESQEILIPVSIFSHVLSPAESIIKYLKENNQLRYSKIGELLERDERGVWGSYNRSVKKMQQHFEIKKPDILIPISQFKSRKLSIFESLILYLKDKRELSGSKISQLLNKKPSTIWTVYNRAKKKI